MFLVEQLESRTRRFKFKKPYELKVKFDASGMDLNLESLGVSACGETKQSALAALGEALHEAITTEGHKAQDTSVWLEDSVGIDPNEPREGRINKSKNNSADCWRQGFVFQSSPTARFLVAPHGGGHWLFGWDPCELAWYSIRRIEESELRPFEDRPRVDTESVNTMHSQHEKALTRPWNIIK